MRRITLISFFSDCVRRETNEDVLDIKQGDVEAAAAVLAKGKG